MTSQELNAIIMVHLFLDSNGDINFCEFSYSYNPFN